MEFSESAHLLLNRIRDIDPDISSKAMGYILLKEYDNGELIRLAFGPDSAVYALIDEIKSAVPLIKMSSPRPPPIITTDTNISKHGLRFLQQQHHHQLLSPTATPIAMSAAVPFLTQQPATYWADQEAPHVLQYTPRSTLDPHVPYATAQGGGGHHMLFSTDDFNPYSTDFTSDSAATILGPRTIRRSSSCLSTESPPPLMSSKTCHYYHKGYCKHGVNCRYLHDISAPLDGYAAAYAANSQSNDLVAANDDHEFVPGSLEKLEAEITELLRSRRGQPISIAMLPMLYQDKYGKVLQADGYLTESQRHGKAGYNLTKLLARMKNSIRLIDRPHGQHSVILAEDLPPPSFEYRGERNDLGSAVSGSQQIYLTFPADSTFTEDDIADYFSQFGPVQGVRIPLQHKRMFGFVTFAHPETVQLVFAKGNPHYICDSRVLVKPYREKTRWGMKQLSKDKRVESYALRHEGMTPPAVSTPHKLQDVWRAGRKSYEKIEIPIYYHPQYADLCTELQPSQKLIETRIYRKQLEQELHRRMSELHLTHHPFSFNPCLGHNAERMIFHEETSVEPNQVAAADESVDTENTTNEQASQIELPDSPFASL